jgi:hypothetical protein
MFTEPLFRNALRKSATIIGSALTSYRIDARLQYIAIFRRFIGAGNFENISKM